MQYNKHIITPEDVKNGIRGITKNVSNTILYNLIEEAEINDLKIAIGDALLIRLYEYINVIPFSEDEHLKLLLEGGIYDATKCVCKGKKFFAGLKKALCYMVYGKYARSGENRLSYTGLVNKTNDYSQYPNDASRQREYKDAYVIANGMLADCMEYITEYCEFFPERQCGFETINNSVTLTVVGE